MLLKKQLLLQQKPLKLRYVSAMDRLDWEGDDVDLDNADPGPDEEVPPVQCNMPSTTQFTIAVLVLFHSVETYQMPAESKKLHFDGVAYPMGRVKFLYRKLDAWLQAVATPGGARQPVCVHGPPDVGPAAACGGCSRGRGRVISPCLFLLRDECFLHPRRREAHSGLTSEKLIREPVLRKGSGFRRS